MGKRIYTTKVDECADEVCQICQKSKTSLNVNRDPLRDQEDQEIKSGCWKGPKSRIAIHLGLI